MSYPDPLDLQAQAAEKAEADKKSRIATQRVDDDLKEIMGTVSGRRFIWSLLERAGVFRLSFNTNALTMALNEGNRNLGLQLFNQIQSACPELYLVMTKEQKKDE